MAEKKTTTKVKSQNAKVKTTTQKSKVEKKVVAKKSVTVKNKEVKIAPVKAEKVTASLTVDVFDITGKVAGKIALPEEIFGAKVNKKLVAQAVRVYLVNQRRGTVSTKTRGEVDGSTRKIYRQKGTGRARHGGIRAPIFVKGGIAHGPKPKDYALSLPKKMKVAAFASAMTSKLQSGEIMVVSGFENVAMKTKLFADAFEKLGFDSKKRNLIVVMSKDNKENYKGMRNLTGVTVTTADRLNTYEVLQHRVVILYKDAIGVFAGENKQEKK